MSEANSKISSASKSGAIAKHCLEQGCNKLVSGINWSRHKKLVHEGKDCAFTKCNGEDCKQCQDGIDNQSDMGSRHGEHLEKTCIKCGSTRRSTMFGKGTSECKVCPKKGSSGKRSEKAGSKKASSLSNEEVKEPANYTFPPVPASHYDIENNRGDAFGDYSLSHEVIKPQLEKRTAAPAKIGSFLTSAALSKLPEDQQEDVDKQVEADYQQINTSSVSSIAEFHFDTPSLPSKAKNQWSQQSTDHKTRQVLLSLQDQTIATAVRVYKLVAILHDCVSPAIIKFIQEQGIELPLLQDVLVEAQQSLPALDKSKLAILAFISILFRGNACTSLVKMFNHLSYTGSLEAVLQLLQPHLSRSFKKEAAVWICNNHTCLDEQTLTLMDYLLSIQHKSLSTMLDISLIVEMQNSMNEFIITVDTCSNAKLPFKLLLEKIKTSNGLNRQKLSFDQFSALIQLLIQNQNQEIIRDNDSLLLASPLLQWAQIIKELQSTLLVQDVESISAFLFQLSTLFGAMPPKFKDKVLVDFDPVYNDTFGEAGIKPNKRQAAIAQYAVARCPKCPLQLWTIPTGQGKSRVAATIALMLLFTETASKVHFVFDSQTLLKRDKEQFYKYWSLNNLEEKVQYHVGLSTFKCLDGEAIVIDEADNFMLGNPAAFDAALGDHICICLTATPDDNKAEGVEKKVIASLSCQRFEFLQNPINPIVDKTISLPTADAVVSFIMDEVKKNAVLLYCPIAFKDYLNTQSVKFFWMDQTIDIDDSFLRSLDVRLNSGLFPVIVATDSFGKRGFDYRAPINGITLLVNDPFDHLRDMIQGLGRVKRFNDPGTVILVEGVALIDEKKELEYKKMLMAYSFQSSKKKNRIIVGADRAQQKVAVPSSEKVGGMTAMRANKLIIPKSQVENTNAKK